MIQSMAEAHISNGVAAAWPTTGTIFSVAEVSRHGSAATAQPPSGSSTAASVNHATTRVRRSGILGVDTQASWDQAVVLTLCPTSPAGSEARALAALSCGCRVAPELLAAAGFSAAGMLASEGRRVELKLLGMVMMSLAWHQVSNSRHLPWPSASRLSPAGGATYCTTNHLAALALAMHEEKRAFRRFLRTVPSRCYRFQLREFFHRADVVDATRIPRPGARCQMWPC
jgi:hypothetical protein